MTIIIFTQKTNTDMDTQVQTREAHIWISDGTTNYVCDRGNLTMTGDLQTVLNAQESTIWADMLAGGVLATAKENAKADRLIYLAANPGAKAIFTLTSAALETEINTVVDVLFSGKLAADRTKVKRLWMVQTLVARESTAGE